MLTTVLCFSSLALSLLSLWIKKEPKIWGTLLSIALFAGLIGGFINIVGLAIVALFFGMWNSYSHKPVLSLFILLTIMGLLLRLHFLPGFAPLLISSKLYLSLKNTLVGLFPLAMLVPLAKTQRDWKQVAKGFLLGIGGIGFMAILAILAGAIQWQPKVPSSLGLRAANNLIFVCITEEGFYRGFIQTTLCKYFKKMRWGNPLALVLTSGLFTLSHFYWTSGPDITLFIFLAGLLFGAVYLFSKRIESAILTHFLLNALHIVFFSYHAM